MAPASLFGRVLFGGLALGSIVSFASEHVPTTVVLSYETLMDAFASTQPNDPSIVRAAAIRERTWCGGTRVHCVFLDANNQVCVDGEGRPYGRTIHATRLDKEVASVFGDRDLLLLT